MTSHAIVNQIYQKRLDSGVYDEFPRVKEVIIKFIISDLPTQYEMLEGKTPGEYLKLYEWTSEKIENYLLQPPKDPFFAKEPGVLLTFYHFGLLKLFDSYYESFESEYPTNFLAEESFTRWLGVNLLGNKGYLVDIISTPQKQARYYKWWAYTNCFAFRGLTPGGVGGDLGMEVALAVPYLDRLNQLGIYTLESAQVHVSSEGLQGFYLRGYFPKDLIPKITALPYVQYRGKTYPHYVARVQTGYIDVCFENTEKYLEDYVMKGEDPFWKEVVGIVEEYFGEKKE